MTISSIAATPIVPTTNNTRTSTGTQTEHKADPKAIALEAAWQPPKGSVNADGSNKYIKLTKNPDIYIDPANNKMKIVNRPGSDTWAAKVQESQTKIKAFQEKIDNLPPGPIATFISNRLTGIAVGVASTFMNGGLQGAAAKELSAVVDQKIKQLGGLPIKWAAKSSLAAKELAHKNLMQTGREDRATGLLTRMAHKAIPSLGVAAPLLDGLAHATTDIAEAIIDDTAASAAQKNHPTPPSTAKEPNQGA